MTIKIFQQDCRELLPMSADVIITDPPYGVDKHGDMIGQLAENYHDKGTHTRGYADHSPEKYAELLEPAFAGMLDSLDKGATMIAFGGNRTFAQMVHIAETAGFETLDILVFPKRKTFARSTSTLVPCHELALFARKPGGTRKFNPKRNIGNVWNITRPQKSEANHPTTKAQAWMLELVKVFSEEGQTILDPFMGSGSTLIAAQELNRNAIGMESIDKYFEEAAERLGIDTKMPIGV